MVCDDLNMSAYAIYNNPKAKPTAKKHKADLLEAFLGALYIDKVSDEIFGIKMHVKTETKFQMIICVMNKAI